MHIQLPNGDRLEPDEEFAKRLGTSRRALSNWDHKGFPFTHIGGRKYRPVNEAMAWVASQIKRRNPPREQRKRAAKAEAQREALKS
jgi:hypothetical protein